MTKLNTKKIVSAVLIGAVALSAVFALPKRKKSTDKVTEVKLGVVGSIYEDLWAPAQNALKA